MGNKKTGQLSRLKPFAVNEIIFNKRPPPTFLKIFKMKDTGLICSGAKPIFVGDKFTVTEHDNECCQHWVDCIVKEDKVCTSGFGLFSIETGKLIANAAIACYRI